MRERKYIKKVGFIKLVKQDILDLYNVKLSLEQATKIWEIINGGQDYETNKK